MLHIKVVSPESTPGNTVYARRTHERHGMSAAIDCGWQYATATCPSDVIDPDTGAVLARVYADGGVDYYEPRTAVTA